MRLLLRLQALVFLGASTAKATPYEEDIAFWQRLLQDDSSLLTPQPVPVEAPTGGPLLLTPAPSVPQVSSPSPPPGPIEVAPTFGPGPTQPPVEPTSPETTPRPTVTDAVPTSPEATPAPQETPLGACDVEVEVACSTDDGRDCSEITSPSTLTCSGGSDIEQVALSYQNCLCDQSTNEQGDAATCQDLGELVPETVTIECVDGDGDATLVVEPAEVVPAGVFTVSSDGSLPDKIECTVIGPDGSPLQRNVIDTSGDVSLQLGDKFGALQLESCNDITCFETLTYDITASNVGGVPMTITVVDFSFNDQVLSLLDRVETNPLEPDEMTSLQEKLGVRVCEAEEYTVSILVEADPPNGEMCQDQEDLFLSVEPVGTTSAPQVQSPAPVGPSVPTPASPTSSPNGQETTPPAPVSGPVTSVPTAEECEIEVEFACTISDTTGSANAGRSCDSPDLGIQPCKERPTAATMLFNGGGCEQSDNRQFLKFTCTDMNGGPPVNEGDEAYIVVTDIKVRLLEMFS